MCVCGLFFRVPGLATSLAGVCSRDLEGRQAVEGQRGLFSRLHFAKDHNFFINGLSHGCSTGLLLLVPGLLCEGLFGSEARGQKVRHVSWDLKLQRQAGQSFRKEDHGNC